MRQFKFYTIMLVVSFLFLYTFGLNSIFNALSEPLLESFHLTHGGIGLVSSLYFYGNILFLIPAGLLIDKIDPKKLIPSVLIACASLTVLMGVIDNLVIFSVCRFLTGLFGAFGFVGCIKVAAYIGNQNNLSKATGMIATLGMLGGFLSQTPLTALIEKTSWQTALIIIGVIGYLLSLVIFLILKPISFKTSIATQSKITLQKAKQVFTNAQNILCALYTGLMNLPIYMLAAMWGIPYLMTVGNYSEIQAASISGMLFAGTIVGSPIVGFLADFTRSSKTIMIIAAALSIFLMLLIVEAHASYQADLILFFLLGFITSAQILSYPIVVKTNAGYLTGTATSLISMISLLGGAIIQPLFGALLSHFSVNNIVTAYSYSAAIKSLVVAFIASVIIAFFIKSERT